MGILSTQSSTLLLLFAFLTPGTKAVDVQSQLHHQTQSGDLGTMGSTVTTNTAHSPRGAPTTPPHLQKRTSHEILTVETMIGGSISVINAIGSVCGFVTSDIHWPVYCGEGQYCATEETYLGCCTSASTYPTTSTWYQTVTTTVRNSYTTTFISTLYNSDLIRWNLYGCEYAPKCYNSTDASSCTGSCTTSAVLCTDQYFPYCASLYMPTWFGTGTGTTSSNVAATYFCDTAAYGLSYGNWGNWPSRTSTYTTTYNYTSQTPTFTPNVVPYSMTQASIPATASLPSVPMSTSAAKSLKPKYGLILILLHLYFLGLNLIG